MEESTPNLLILCRLERADNDCKGRQNKRGLTADATIARTQRMPRLHVNEVDRTRLENQSCLLHDGEMCERKAGMVSLRWRRNATNRTVTARSRRAALSRFPSLPPPRMPFFHTSSQHPSPEPFPHSPAVSVFSASNIVHTYSSSTALVYSSHPHPISAFALLPPSHPYMEEVVTQEKSSA